ncbi:MAG: hypothetical protein P8Y64_00940 [Gammaproteobacteria bacterium]
MKKWLLILVLLLVPVAALVGYIVLEKPQPRTITNLPWQISVFPDGTSQVFGIHLGVTTLDDMARDLKSVPDVGLFRSPDGHTTLEAYFGKQRLGIFEARLIAVLAASPVQLDEMMRGAAKKEPMPSGSYQFTLAESDLKSVYALPVSELSYVPSAQYTPDIVSERFGVPEEKIPFNDHQQWWLYPKRGLALMLDTQGKSELHYVRPADFDALKQRIQALKAKPPA